MLTYAPLGVRPADMQPGKTILSSCTLTTLAKPCPSGPWRVNKSAADITNFDLELAQSFADCCPDSRNMGPDFGASMFACHQSKEGGEIACAGWMATVATVTLVCVSWSLWAGWMRQHCGPGMAGRACIQTNRKF